MGYSTPRKKYFNTRNQPGEGVWKTSSSCGCGCGGLGLVNSHRQSDMDSIPECAERGWPEIGWGSGSTGHLRASGCVIYFFKRRLNRASAISWMRLPLAAGPLCRVFHDKRALMRKVQPVAESLLTGLLTDTNDSTLLATSAGAEALGSLPFVFWPLFCFGANNSHLIYPAIQHTTVTSTCAQTER